VCQENRARAGPVHGHVSQLLERLHVQGDIRRLVTLTSADTNAGGLLLRQLAEMKQDRPCERGRSALVAQVDVQVGA